MDTRTLFSQHSDEIIEAYRWGIDNKIACHDDYLLEQKKRSAKLITYYLVICVINKNKKIGNRVTLLNGMSQKDNAESKKLPLNVFRGKWFNSICELRNGTTIVSPFSLTERINILYQAITSARAKKIDIEETGPWLDFYFLVSFLSRQFIKTVNGRGHYDQNATWLGFLSRIIGYEYNIYQHGVVSKKVDVPHKFPCDKVFVFDNYSANVFKNNIILNDDCQYEVIDFSPSVKFQKIEKNQPYIYIGLVEQNDPNWINNMVKLLQNNNVIIYVMKHPLTDYHYQSTENIIVTDKKILNLDLIVSYNSTLVLDYIRAGYSKDIVITDAKNAEIFADYDQVQLVTDEKVLKQKIRKMREER